MKRKTYAIILVLVALAVCLCVLVGCGSGEQTRLVRAWQLTSKDRYTGDSMKDPVISWSPDSKLLAFTTTQRKDYRTEVMGWNVGENALTNITDATSPNFVDNNTLLVFRQNPIGIYERDMRTGKEHTIAPQLRNLDLWRDITAFNYNPTHKTIELRFSNFTRYYEPGCEEIDLNGKFIRNIPRATGAGVLDRSDDPKGGRSAIVFGDLTNVVSELRLGRSDRGDTNGKLIEKGNIGAVSWAPDGRVIAYSEDNVVKVCSPSGDGKTVVARFGRLPDSGDPPRICRLVWSPDGSYLATIELIPNDDWVCAMVYVLDMSKVAR